MQTIRVRKLVLISFPCVLLAAIILVLSLSSALSRTAPVTALTLWPANGMAKEELAFDVFASATTDPMDLQGPAEQAQEQALSAYLSDPLAPKALTILALASKESDTRAEILDSATALNRRDLALQGLVLQRHSLAGDYTSMIETLDQMFRTHVKARQQFFPVLVQALKTDGTQQQFVDLLARPAPWHESFMRIALDDADARIVFASIRDQLNTEDPEFDRRLIERLASQGELSFARDVYERVRDAQSDEANADTSGWPSQYPPYDWALSDEADLRGQPSRTGDVLEIFVRSGTGGDVASRIMDFPKGPFVIAANLGTPSGLREGAIRIGIDCADDGRRVFEAPLGRGSNRIEVAELNADCDQKRLVISVRSRQSEPTLRANLSRVKLTNL